MALRNHKAGLFRKAAAYLLSAALLLFCMAGAAHADERQYKIEAAFLYNFFDYVTWPGYHSPEDMAQATVCLAGSDPLQPYLEYIQHKRHSERVMRIRRVDGDYDLSGCQMIFIRGLGGDRLAALRDMAVQKGVLLVSSDPDFVGRGGMIGLTQEDERIAIEIDHTLLKQAGFKVSSRLLELARKVE